MISYMFWHNCLILNGFFLILMGFFLILTNLFQQYNLRVLFVIGLILLSWGIKPYVGMGVVSTAEHFDANHMETPSGSVKPAWTVRCYGAMLGSTGCVLNWESPLPCEKRIVKFCDFWFPPEMEK